MALLPYLVSAAIGSVIGGGTNYFAIRMLFRPYRQLRILGVRVPFTPGVIPSRQEQLAESVAEAVSRHLVTPEELRKALESPEISASIHEAILKNLQSIMTDPLEETVCAGGEVSWEAVRDAVAEHLEAAIVRTTKTRAFETVIHRLLGSSEAPSGTPETDAAGSGDAEVVPTGIPGARTAFWNTIRTHAGQFLYEILSTPETAAWLVQELRPVLDENLGQLRPGTYLPDPSVRRIADLLAGRVMTFLKKDASTIIERIDIRAMVARRVAEFPMADLEGIVIACARRELRAITVLGFLLGAVVGLLNPVLNGVFSAWMGG